MQSLRCDQCRIDVWQCLRCCAASEIEHAVAMQEVQKSGKGEGRVFFVELEFKESQALFHRLAANSLPWIVHVSGSLNIGSDGPLKIKHEDVVSLSL